MSDIYEYGNSPAFAFDILRPGANDVDHGVAERVPIDTDTYHQALDDIRQTLKVYEDPETGKHFEIAIANVHSTEDTTDAEHSTFSSAITNNMGNAIEFAIHAASHPERRRVYIASYGNGGSSFWDPAEQHYITETGRFIRPDGTPLPTVAALGRVLRNADLVVSRLSADSAGGTYATALMTALPEGQVTHAYFKSRLSISNHHYPLVWGARQHIGENRDKHRMEAVSQDPWFKTEQVRTAAQEVLGDIYGDSDGSWSLREAVLSKLKTSAVTAVALSHGGGAYAHPAVKDTWAALDRQGDAKLTYHFPTGDRAYGPHLKNDVRSFLLRVGLAGINERQVEALIVPGSHLDHGPYPTMRASLEAYAFER